VGRRQIFDLKENAMADAPVEMKATLGLTGLTMNAMALIAPGAFLWLTYAGQAAEGATAPSMWIGIVFATALCLATAVCYAEMAKLYPGTGSSYYFAEQSFLNHETAWPMPGWPSSSSDGALIFITGSIPA
jgi:amino acid transporter